MQIQDIEEEMSITQNKIFELQKHLQNLKLRAKSVLEARNEEVSPCHEIQPELVT